MKYSATDVNSELQLLDSIDRLSRQLHFLKPGSENSAQQLSVQPTVESLEEELESIRIIQQKHNHRK